MKIASNNSDIAIVPDDECAASFPDAVRAAELVRSALLLARSRRRQRSQRSHADILDDLWVSLRRPDNAAVLEALRSRYTTALIDEFQDTDPVQWAIFSTIFAGDTSGRALVLVGDPKQAIYAFRGANLETYLAAVGADATTRRSLRTNWRSDQVVLDAVAALCRGATFGDSSIAFVPVDAAPSHRDTHIRGYDTHEPVPALSLRLGVGFSADDRSEKTGKVKVDPARRGIRDDAVRHIVRLLDTAEIPAVGHDVASPAYRRVRPGDIAVLVRTNDQAAEYQQACIAAGVPAVLRRGASVLEAPAAEQWRLLLDAMARPSDPRRARSFAVSWFGGHDAAWVAAADDPAIAALQEQLHDWSEVLVERGVGEMVRRVFAGTGVIARLLRRPDGRRDATDLEHVGELLQTAASNRRIGIVGLLAAIESAAKEADDPDNADDPAARRIDTDAESVQVMTMHVAKGLEYPIVLCPMLWEHRRVSGPLVVTDPDTGARLLDVAPILNDEQRGKPKAQWPDKQGADERQRRASHERASEELRLAYVAITRAQHHAVVWWVDAQSHGGAPLHRLLFARDESGAIDPERFTAATVPIPSAPLEAVAPIVAAASGTIVAEPFGSPQRTRVSWSDPMTPTHAFAELAVAHLDHTPDRRSRRWSFSAITDRVEGVVDPLDESGADRGAADENIGAPVVDVPRADTAPAPTTDTDEFVGTTSSPVSDDADHPPMVLDRLPAGAAFGTLVHTVLERVEFGSDTLASDLDDAIDYAMRRRRLDIAPVSGAGRGAEILRDGLLDVVRTPLGSMLGGRRLVDFGPGDHLDELDFDLLLATSGRATDDRRIGSVLLDTMTPDHPLVPWARRLAAGQFGAVLAGHLTGSIDLVVRVPIGDDVRYVVLDYKTNRLSAAGAAGALDDYAPDRLVDAMAHHHYPLQALLYSVALHRHLRGRLAGYDPARHLGGAAYLFVRAMVGPDTPVIGGEPVGVFTWAIPPAAVESVSDLLDGYVP